VPQIDLMFSDPASELQEEATHLKHLAAAAQHTGLLCGFKRRFLDAHDIATLEKPSKLGFPLCLK
jgi:hypothetical protein